MTFELGDRNFFSFQFSFSWDIHFFQHANILEEHIRCDVKGAILVTLRQMVDFCYPFPKMNCVEFLTPVMPTKVRFDYIFHTFMFYKLTVNL